LGVAEATPAGRIKEGVLKMSKVTYETEFKLKVLRTGAIPAALERAERYRLLNEPTQAESICLDILEVDPENQRALIQLLLSITDQFDNSHSADRASPLLVRLSDAYDKAYYRGIVYERRARAQLHRTGPGVADTAYHLLREAMQCYEKAETLRPADNDETILRWNTCARTIMSEHLRPLPPNDSITMLE
jgi:tetratricopeptide (TPR) repeat protein